MNANSSVSATSNDTLTATSFGLVAVLLWSTLAVVNTQTGAVPPFQLVAMSFAISTVVGFGWAKVTGERLSDLGLIGPSYWLVGVTSLLGYHAAYFSALQTAPVVEANLINYLWPLLIVVFSTALPLDRGGHRLRWWHVVGALMGFAGITVILIGDRSVGSLGSGATLGYVAALAAALIWSAYSVVSRLFKAVPSVAIMGTSALTAVGAAIISALYEAPVWPADGSAWLAIAAQGLGPVGLAFYLWDRAVKHGHIRVVGIVSYLTPLLSTCLLIATGSATATVSIWFAALLITLGAMIGSAEVWMRQSTSRADQNLIDGVEGSHK